MNSRRYFSLASLGMTAMLSAVFVPAASAADRAAPAPDVNLLGARSLQHALSIPAPQNPFHDQTGAYCSLWQSGSVWFLYITNGNPIGEPVVRECTIPVGKTIFMPIMSWVCLPFPNETVQFAIDGCKEINDKTDILRLRIDGKARNDLITRRASSHAFALVLPDDNIFGVPASIVVAVHDGYFATLPPLGVGTHIVRVQGGTTSEGFTSDVRYRLKVVKPIKLP
jgi:hypothetical protein